MKKNAQTLARAVSTPSAPPSPCSPGRERLTWPEIQARYPEQWVVLVDIERIDGELHTARVLYAGQGRNETLRESKPVREQEGYVGFAHRYTGRIKSPIYPINLWLYR